MIDVPIVEEMAAEIALSLWMGEFSEHGLGKIERAWGV